MLKTERMDDAPILRKYTDFEEMKADEYRYWQSRSAHERLDAVDEMIETAYALKGIEVPPLMDKTIVRKYASLAEMEADQS